jgi:hypothetical protein
MPRWLTTIDREELSQVRALAEVEGACPKQAVREFLQQEHRYYDLISMGGGRLARVPQHVPIAHHSRRSAESIERRKAYTREWWRLHGKEYRAKRRTT